MKKITILLCVLFVCNNILSQNISEGGVQFLNNSFEQWDYYNPTDSSSLEPLHWHAYMSAYGEYNPLQNALYQQIWPSHYLRPGATGSLSAKITARDVLGVMTANGGLTNGRIHVGSTSVGDSTNYNITLRDNPDFNTPLNMFPDSLTIWVTFCCEYNNQQARVRAIVHGDADFCERANGSLTPYDKLTGQALAYFTRTNAINDTINYHWRRLSVPFVYDGPCNDPKYVLFTIATNKFAGQGLGNEYIILDDLLLIYNPTLTLGELNVNNISVPENGYMIDIPFIIQGTMSPSNLNMPANVVTAQLSDSTGNFENPIIIGQKTTNESGIINAVIPHNIPCGNNYRIRVVSSNYPLISEDNGYDIAIHIIDGALNYPNNVRIYPTVADNKIYVESIYPIKNITFYNFLGAKIKQVYCQDNNLIHLIDVSDLNNGIYIVVVQLENQFFSNKIILQKKNK